MNQNFFQKGNYFLIPLRDENDQPIILRLSGKKFNIYEHTHGKDRSYSLGIDLFEPNLSEEDFLGPISDLEKEIQNLALENKPAIKEIHPKFADFKKDDFHLIKKDRSNKSKIFAKIPFKNDKIIPTFWERIQWGENQKPKKMKSNPLELIDMDLHGDVIVEVRQIFCSNIKSITCVVKEALFWEIEKPQSFFDEGESLSSDEEED